ncbi:MAG: AraC family transcriptional regulator [Rhizobium sp.]|nr:AraC family transcriptional regulator [Rhizobium sp.]
MTPLPTFLESLHAVPDAGWSGAALSIVRAGKVRAAADYRVEREALAGQDVLYCLAGAGTVETLGRRLRVRSGQLAWIANELPHAHEADPDDPWTLLWFRLDGPDPPQLRRKIFGDRPGLIDIEDHLALEGWFNRLFRAMRGGGSGLAIRLNQLAGEFLVHADNEVRGDPADEVPPSLASAINAMRSDLAHGWTSLELSKLIGLSQSQLRRLFSQHLRTSPHQWLLRERLNRAQTLMSDSTLPLAEIAELCGFCDVYHFGREFRRSIGTPPAAWRRLELGRAR